MTAAQGFADPAEPLSCPKCGQTAKVRYRTVMRAGVRVPVDPSLVCLDGHESPVLGELAGLRGPDDDPQPGDEGLIG